MPEEAIVGTERGVDPSHGAVIDVRLIPEGHSAPKPAAHGRSCLPPRTFRILRRGRYVRFEAIACGPVRIAGKRVVIEEPEPVGVGDIGERLWLEDLIVTESERGSGIGRLLLNRTMQKALDADCTGIMWQVLEWNEPAINFYKKFDAKLDDEWTNVSLERDQLVKLLENP